MDPCTVRNWHGLALSKRMVILARTTEFDSTVSNYNLVCTESVRDAFLNTCIAIRCYNIAVPPAPVSIVSLLMTLCGSKYTIANQMLTKDHDATMEEEYTATLLLCAVLHLPLYDLINRVAYITPLLVVRGHIEPCPRMMHLRIRRCARASSPGTSSRLHLDEPLHTDPLLQTRMAPPDKALERIGSRATGATRATGRTAASAAVRGIIKDVHFLCTDSVVFSDTTTYRNL